MRSSVALATALLWGMACSEDEPGPLGDGAGGASSGGAAASGGVPAGGTAGTAGWGGKSTGGTAVTGGAPSSGGSSTTGGTASDGGGAGNGGEPPDASDDGPSGSGGAGPGGAPTGGTHSGGSSSGGVGTDSGKDDGGPARQPCLSPQQVVVLGDSFFTGATSGGLVARLATLDPRAIAFRDVTMPGASLVVPPLATLSERLGQTIAADPNIGLLIANGGFTDSVTCSATNCPSVCGRPGALSVKLCTDTAAAAINAAEALFAKAAAAGVENIVWVSYPHVPADQGGRIELLDFMATHIRTKCNAVDVKTRGKTHCHFLDLVEPFKAGGDLNPANFTTAVFPHPSQAGFDLMASELNRLLKDACLGQPRANACCQ